MFKRRLLVLLLLLVASSAVAAQQAHMVFFTLAEPNDAGRKELAAACHKHLAKIEGITYFSVGVIAEDLKREVNDRSFDVALHVVFEDRAAYKVYETHPKHLAFIDEAKSLWSKVKVFDSDLVPAGHAPEEGSAAAAEETQPASGE